MFQDSGRHDFCALEDELEVRPTIDQIVFACLGKKKCHEQIIELYSCYIMLY